MAGKGDRYRSVNRKKWDENWRRIFRPANTFFKEIGELQEILDETNKQEDDNND